MVLELRQQLKLTQQLVMTPQLQQAIKLLQLSRLELAEMVQQEIEQNPILEEDAAAEGGDSPEGAGDQEAPVVEKTTEVEMESTSSLQEIDWQDYANEYEAVSTYKPAESSDLPSRLDIVSKKPNLQSHLQWQLGFVDIDEKEQEVSQFIIGNLDRDGILQANEQIIMEQTGCDQEMAEDMIALIQEMDPAGIGARSVKESLLLQLVRLGLGNSLAADIVQNHLNFLETRNYGAIVKATGKPKSDVLAAITAITHLNPFPGRQYSDEEPHYIVPDVYVYKIDDDYVILLNDEGLPRLKVSAYYKEILSKESTAPEATKNYIQDKMKSAAWLIKSIQQRQRTIYRVVESIVKFQGEFFEKGVSTLKPLVLRDVAEDIEMHESTISRVTSNKYVHTPQGTFELKYFFNSAIERTGGGDSLSSASIKDRIKSIVSHEDPNKPFSDNAIAEIFKKDDIKLARRTVAKYREQLGILPSKSRKKPKF